MFRTVINLTWGLAALVSLNAGQIQIGGTSGTAGITANYVNGVSGCAATYSAGQTSQAGYTGCLAGGVTNSLGTGNTNFKLFSYQASLFSAATQATVSVANPPSVINTTDVNSTPVTFDMMAQQWGGSGGTSDGTTSGTATTTSLTIPISIFSVDKAWTVLQDYWGQTGGTNTSVTFNFGTTSSQASGYDAVTFNFTNGNQIRDAVDCSGASTAPAPDGTHISQYTGSVGGCQQYAETTSSAATKNAFSEAYNGDQLVGSMYYYTTGTVNLDDQLFNFGNAHAAEWLDSIVITNTGGLGQVVPATSRTSLAAITVDSTVLVATPEPGSIFLLLSGLGAIGIARFRRK